jgi:hypothetical protein
MTAIVGTTVERLVERADPALRIKYRRGLHRIAMPVLMTRGASRIFEDFSAG